MIWLLLVGAVALIALYLYSLFVQGEIRQLVRTLRWVVGGGLVAGAALLGLRGQMLLASFMAAGGLGVLMRGRLGRSISGPACRARTMSRAFLRPIST